MNLPSLVAGGEVVAQVGRNVGVITLNRPAALNALSLAMIRDLTALLLAWAQEARIVAVVVRGAGRPGKPPAFCAGGDIRFFHQAALAGDPRLEDFFSEEYALNHLIHRYPKPYVALMDGVTMGGGMGISQGAAMRVVTEHSRLAMPETNIGLFPDVGGGWFLSRCPGHVGEYLALTGQVLTAGDALAFGLADAYLASGDLSSVVEALLDQPMENGEQVLASVQARASATPSVELALKREQIDRHFSAPSLQAILESLAGDADPFAVEARETLAKRSPLMMAVTLEQVRRARQMTLAEDLRMERDLVRHCFHLPGPLHSETVEGIRALAIDKDHSPRWQPHSTDQVSAEMVGAFFCSPWPAHAHPLRDLTDAA